MTYMKQAGLLERPKRAHYEITERGRTPSRQDSTASPSSTSASTPSSWSSRTGRIRRRPARRRREFGCLRHDAVGHDRGRLPDAARRTGLLLLDQVMACSPEFFERLVVDLLVAMGYGGSRLDAGKAVGKSGDGGIDGVIKEDRLGLDTVCIQAKRWEGVVGSDRVQAFAGSLEGAKASKGVIITTSHFSPAAKAYVEKIAKRIVLIDGPRLAELMMDFGIGVTEEDTYSVKKLDGDYFEGGAL